ncbi:hypothetical protein Tco_0682996 [Tanacetum coccineum]|uniref:CCHC-type domain-containing protein n=1 Tax=Tanacetum coccineum TaxID=301880 RepID=A0ABQ4XUC6_9ASTR
MIATRGSGKVTTVEVLAKTKDINNCKRIRHLNRDCKAFAPATTSRPSVARKMTEVAYCECGRLGHYKSDCPIWKCQNCANKY